MELVLKKNENSKRSYTITGLFSFCCAIMALFVLNLYIITKFEHVPDFFVNELPMIGIILGIIGTMTKTRSRKFALWGIALNVFIYLFIFLMFGLSWSINPKP